MTKEQALQIVLYLAWEYIGDSETQGPERDKWIEAVDLLDDDED